MDLQTLANLSQIIGVIAVVAAVGFGLVQVRQFRVQRRDAAGAELVRSFQDAEFIQAYRALSALPANATAEEFRAPGPEIEEAALTVGMRFELIGLLVFREIMPLSLVAQSTGSVAVVFWGKMRAWVEERREADAQPHLLEWFQWLSEQLEKRGRRVEPPAFARYSDWQPPRSNADDPAPAAQFSDSRYPIRAAQRRASRGLR
ncbi:hypothetical protein BH18VER1_BH18VER1_10930 [soil metagenome]